MSWDFRVRGISPIFAVAVAEVEPNSEHVIQMYGRTTNVGPDAVLHHNVSALIDGSGDITWPGHKPYSADESMWLKYTAAGQDELNTAHRCPRSTHGKLTTPDTPDFTAKSGRSGLTYVCFSVLDDTTMLDYDVFVGPHRYRFQNDDMTGDRPGYAVVARGHACMAGIGDCERWKVYEFPPRDVIFVEGDDDSIVFYLWERV